MIKATALLVGDTIVSPFGLRSTVSEVKVGTRFVNVRLVGRPRTRYEHWQEIWVAR